MPCVTACDSATNCLFAVQAHSISRAKECNCEDLAAPTSALSSHFISALCPALYMNELLRFRKAVVKTVLPSFFYRCGYSNSEPSPSSTSCDGEHPSELTIFSRPTLEIARNIDLADITPIHGIYTWRSFNQGSLFFVISTPGKRNRQNRK
ncbi:hypothetical protein BOTBODRAFT_179343 [Botryobasidium botryosum FD-172 SS1]|uniref:Uncharacterized protein n=1 Tax=Botryobasidium botryosum (strain FD-172 SS1) TaxID=930990 RepID=A0A067M0D5_BOTB1|nr:hypothetical protein BOTBODRAFT_179343 [Botryobasidium botryosum FD-172 SS1]